MTRDLQEVLVVDPTKEALRRRNAKIVHVLIKGVMAEDEAVRNNRLALLAFLRDLFLNVADISLLQE